MPMFYCEDIDESCDGSFVLHYHSKRGNILVPLAKGVVSEAPRMLFDLEIKMTQLTTQGVNGAKMTR